MFLWSFPAIKIGLAQQQGQNKVLVFEKKSPSTPFPPFFHAFLICESMSFMTCYFHFPHGSGRQMSDNGMLDPVKGGVSTCLDLYVFILSMYMVGRGIALLSQGIY